MIIDPSQHDHIDIYKLMIGSIVPRPIGFISSIDSNGRRNLAPFSFFNGVCSNPPTVLFCPSIRKDGQRKDTWRNVESTGEFVVNIVSEDIAEQMNLTSADFPPEVDEFTVSGLTPVPSDCVKPPRVKESKISMECAVTHIVPINDSEPGGGCVVIGRIIRFHIADELFDHFRIDPARLQAIGRMGGPTYTRTQDRFDLIRPKTGELKS